MDRNNTIGLVLISVIFVGWFYWSYSQQEAIVKSKKETSVSDSTAVKKDTATAPVIASPVVAPVSASDTLFAVADTTSRFVTITTSDYTATLSGKGAVLTSFQIGKYLHLGKPVELISEPKTGNLNYQLKLANGSVVNTRDLSFKLMNEKSDYVLKGEKDSVQIAFSSNTVNNQVILATYTFHGSGYVIDHKLVLKDFQTVLTSQQILLEWKNGIAYSEPDKVAEATGAETFIHADDFNDYLNATATDVDEEMIYAKTFKWTAIRTKYFAVAIENIDKKANSTKVFGRTYNDAQEKPTELYNMVQYIPYNAESYWEKSTRITLTPLDYYYLKGLDNDLQSMMSLGIPWVVKPISEYFVLPLFIFLKNYLPSWGLVIIIFTLIIKLLLYPLTQSQTQGMKKMATVAPLMKEMQEKYKDDKEKLQQEMLKLYREHGYNPLAGCLPMLLQMPILFALYTVFANAIEFRQSAFLWIDDLSLPDMLFHLPFTIPFYGSHFSLFAFLVAGSQIIQMKMQPQTDKTQAAIMMWVFPVMMLMIFNNLSAGLNMYYFLFNVLTLAQQWFYNQKESSLLSNSVTVTTGKK